MMRNWDVAPLLKYPVEIGIVLWDWEERKRSDKKTGKTSPKFLDFLNEEIKMLNEEEVLEEEHRKKNLEFEEDFRRRMTQKK
jgi:hypothetical protein